MSHLTIVRATLVISAIFNMIGAYTTVWPESALSQNLNPFISAPRDAAVMLAYVFVIFAVLFLYMAFQRRIDRSLLAFCAIGKCGMFLTLAGLWLAGASSSPDAQIQAAAGDLGFGVVWGSWLLRTYASWSPQTGRGGAAQQHAAGDAGQPT